MQGLRRRCSLRGCLYGSRLIDEFWGSTPRSWLESSGLFGLRPVYRLQVTKRKRQRLPASLGVIAKLFQCGSLSDKFVER